MLKSYESRPRRGVGDLASRVCDGDPDCITQFYCDLLVPIAKAVLRSRKSNALEAEELANIAFLHLCENNWQRLRTHDGTNLNGWVWKTIYRLFLKKVQDLSRSSSLDDQAEICFAVEDHTLDRLIVEQTKSWLLDAIEAVKSPRHRLVLYMRFVKGMDYASIASELGIPIGTVHVIVNRWVRNILNLLNERPPHADASGN